MCERRSILRMACLGCTDRTACAVLAPMHLAAIPNGPLPQPRSECRATAPYVGCWGQKRRDLTFFQRSDWQRLA